MAGATALYTPQVLALAASLAGFPLDPALPLHGSARSRSCGSTLRLGLDCGGGQRIERIGIRAQACAIGQAAAAIFAAAAKGRSAQDIAESLAQLAAWLDGAGPAPAWPGIGVLEAARAYPARHGAIGLAWQAALEALSSRAAPG